MEAEGFRSWWNGHEIFFHLSPGAGSHTSPPVSSRRIGATGISGTGFRDGFIHLPP